MNSTVLITGASSGIGNLTARTLAAAGHTVFASMLDVKESNAKPAADLIDFAAKGNYKLKTLQLDVLSQDSANDAVTRVIGESGKLDVVVNNAGHMVVGYAEAFTAQDLRKLFDINVFGVQRVNRAVLPHMRERRSGVLLYVGSTIPVSSPPWLSPYVASKAASDSLAITTAYEVAHFGIETVIVMPGAFTTGTQHFPNAGHASDRKVTKAYAELDALLARNEEATNELFEPGVDANPKSVAEEIARILALPVGEKPLRSVVDFTHAGVDNVNKASIKCQRDFVTRMGYAELLSVRIPASGDRSSSRLEAISR